MEIDNSNIEKLMIQDNEFKPLEKNSVQDSISKFVAPKRVIKQKDVKLNEPVKINIDEYEYRTNSTESIQPIIDDGCVVGVFYTCTCGKSTEIRFDYEN